MISPAVREEIIEHLVAERGAAYRTLHFRKHGAGGIDDTLEACAPGAESAFIKTGPLSALDRYQKEALGLKLLRQCNAIRVPDVIFIKGCSGAAVLALEFIDLHPIRQYETRMGTALAEMHQIHQHRFGLDHDNYIGRTPQCNTWQDSHLTQQWWPFFCENRLQFQLELALKRGMKLQSIERLSRLIQLVPVKLAEHRPAASLLHGDLWSGNWAVDSSGKPTLFDPAVYFGDAETDIAMSKMFGSMGQQVYQAYDNVIEKAEGHEVRQKLYDLYHWLNHFNLFGGSYLSQANVTLDELLYELE